MVFTGDVVSGEGTPFPGAALREATGIADSREIPWTLVLGNHDDEGRASRADLVSAREAASLLSRRARPCRDHAASATTSCVSSSSRSPRLALALYFLDSGAYDALGLRALRLDQARPDRVVSGDLWAACSASSSLPGGRWNPLPALAFFHIPLPEWDEVWRTQECRGHRQEPVCSPALNSGFFAAMAESGDVMGAFCGHDHLNDYEGELHGIRLCYGRATGFGEYGKEGFPRGARVIRLREGRAALRDLGPGRGRTARAGASAHAGSWRS